MASQEGTDLRKWKLHVEAGRQTWHYSEHQDPSEQNFYDRYFLGLDISKDAPALPKPKDVKEATRNAMDFFTKLQTDDGHWGNDYGGPMFLLPGLIITCYITGTDLGVHRKTEIIRYLMNHINEEGAWGLHVESEATAFGAALNYVALRLLGVSPDDARMAKARAFLHSVGGAVAAPHWGKFWLATLGVMDWDAINAVLPELWLLPYALPFHPGRFWCHCRVVYLPMAYIYGRKATGVITPLIKEIREEIYCQPYDSIKWSSNRWTIAKQDLYKPHSLVVKVAMTACNIFDSWLVPNWLRNKALASTLDHIRYEDKETHYIDIGPVNKCMDMLSEFYASNGQSEAFRQHQERLLDYLWLAKDGMKMQGYNGCQLWDTAFALQGLSETGLLDEFRPAIEKAYEYVDVTQVRENATDGDTYFRHISKGAWPFSTKDHGWPISDCTAEGFRAAMLLPQRANWIKPLSDDRLFDAVNVMLSYQNTDGGWPTYELKRAGGWLELMNPAECFDGIMVDYSYVECTGAVLKSFIVFQKSHPNHRKAEIDTAIKNGLKYIRSIQRPDGSWHGSWAVCYTYAIWFGVSTLAMAGFRTDSAVIRACEFLRGKQAQDGSWGEDFKSCVKRVWVPNPAGGHVVHTAWACMSLMDAEREEDAPAVRRGIEWILAKQLPNGDWEQQSIVGVFNFNCAISYEGYKNYFTIWALGRYFNSYKYGSNFAIKQ